MCLTYTDTMTYLRWYTVRHLGARGESEYCKSSSSSSCAAPLSVGGCMPSSRYRAATIFALHNIADGGCVAFYHYSVSSSALLFLLLLACTRTPKKCVKILICMDCPRNRHRRHSSLSYSCIAFDRGVKCKERRYSINNNF